MLNFLKRFLWPSRISQESIGAMIFEQREEILRLQNQADFSADTITKIAKTISSLEDIQAALKVIQPHLFDIQYGIREHTQRIHAVNEQNEGLRGRNEENFKLLVEKLKTMNDATSENFETNTNNLKDLAQTLQTSNAQAFNSLKEKTETLQTSNAQAFNSLKEKIAQEALLLVNKSEENKNLTVHEVTTAQSDINALANKVAELGTAINHDGTNPETVDLSPLFDTIQNFVAETQLAVTNSGFENRNILLHEFSSHQTDIKEMKEFLSPLTLAIDNLSQRIEQEALNTQNRSDENRNLTLYMK